MRGISMSVRWRAGALAICFASVPLWPAPNSPVSFRSDVAPILEKNCVTCHGPAQQLSMLDLSSRAAALKGGQKGPAIIPGDAERSLFYRRITGQDQPAMPLGGKLSPADIATLRKWIDAGAPWETALEPAPPVPTQDRNWWSLRQPVRPPVPHAGDPRWNANPIDAFLKKALDKKGLEPAPRADRRTLLRRAYLDLTGLLPPP